MTATHALALATLVVSGPAQDLGREDDSAAVMARAKAIDQGVAWLVEHQLPDGGMPQVLLNAHDPFVDAAFTGLALLAAGERLEAGAHHPALRNTVRWLQERIPEYAPIRVERPRPEGDWQRHESWYVAVAALLFAELHQQTPTKDLARTARRLRARIVALQKPTGGWCHDLQPRVREIPGIGRAEYSEDLCAVGSLCVAALDALSASGIGAPAHAPDNALRRGIVWLQSLQSDDGGFQYGTGHPGEDALLSEPGRSAGALFALLPLQGRDDPRSIRAVAYLDREFSGIPFSAWHAGKPFVISWLTGAWCCSRWSPAATERYLKLHGTDILHRQQDDGSFRLGISVWDTGTIATATAVMALLGERSALRLAQRAPVGSGTAAAEDYARWLREHAAGGEHLEGRWGDMSVDLALTGVAAQALHAYDALGHGAVARDAALWTANEIVQLHARDFRSERRSHLSFQLPLALPLLLAHSTDALATKAAQHVVDELVATQRQDGGWSYDRDPLYTLISTTAPAAMALCDARSSGLEVPTECIERAADYVEACQGDGGGFRYCPRPSHPLLLKDRAQYMREEVPRTVVALACLEHAGRGGGTAHARGVAFLTQVLTTASIPNDDHHLWFSLLWGDRFEGTRTLRDRWDRLILARLQALREPDGSQRWPGMAWSEILGRPPMYPVFATAAALHLRAKTPRLP